MKESRRFYMRFDEDRGKEWLEEVRKGIPKL